MARVVRLTPYFRRSLDIAGLTTSAQTRARVARVLNVLEQGPLPRQGDAEALLPWPGTTAWAHYTAQLGGWVLYTFDIDHVDLLWFTASDPVFVE